MSRIYSTVDDNEEKLDERKKDIILMIQQGFTLEQIGKKYNISRQRVSQIVQNVKIERPIKPPKPRQYFTCNFCNQQFEKKYNSQKFCSKRCAGFSIRGGKSSRYEFVRLKCSCCNKDFKKSNYILNIYSTAKHRFCNIKCYLKYLKFNFK